MDWPGSTCAQTARQQIEQSLSNELAERVRPAIADAMVAVAVVRLGGR